MKWYEKNTEATEMKLRKVYNPISLNIDTPFDQTIISVINDEQPKRHTNKALYCNVYGVLLYQ